eukprot:7657806-Pyramimonas_sp.AAC.2
MCADQNNNKNNNNKVSSLHKPRRVPGRCGDTGTDEGEPKSRKVANRWEVGSRRGEVGLKEGTVWGTLWGT